MKQASVWCPGLAEVFRFDFLQLIPGWTFFAPNPVLNEPRVFVRLRTKGLLGNWMELRITGSDGRWLAFVRPVFNPRRRFAKELLDFSTFLRGSALPLTAVRACSDLKALHRRCAAMAAQHGAESWELALAESSLATGSVELIVLLDTGISDVSHAG